MGGVPKRLGRSPYKICELDLSSLKASKNLEFLDKSRIPKINLEFLSLVSSHSLTGGSHQITVIAREQSDRSNLIQNSVIAKIAVIASEAKQSLGIINSSLGILNFCSL